MSSTTRLKTGFASDNIEHEDTAKLIIGRLLWIAVTTIASWVVVGVLIHFTHFPAYPRKLDELGIYQSPILSVQFAAAILIAHFVSVFVVQIFAPRAVNRARLASNTMFSALVLSLCASVSVVSRMIPVQGIPYLNSAIQLAYQPTFIIANLLLCGITGLMIYWSREIRLADMVEIYWSLGLMFLLALSTALVMAVVSV
ncbi:MAG: hypothetical protein SGJ27_12740 [Candidatus Melainabacteria bacterium]|nr:hypothetical protein [Candidatus Melainabacteria bacterium]